MSVIGATGPLSRMLSETSPLGRVIYGLIAASLVLVVIEMLYFFVANPMKISDSHVDSRWDEITVPELDPPIAVEIFQPAIDRSLFSWNRRPVVAEQPQAGVNNGEIESRWGLSGIVAAGDSSYAMFRSLLDEEPLRLELGMYLEEWRVDEITTEVVNLTAEGKKKQFRLDETDIKRSSGKIRRRNTARRDKKTRSLQIAEQAALLAEDDALVPVLKALMEAKEAESKENKAGAGGKPTRD